MLLPRASMSKGHQFIFDKFFKPASINFNLIDAEKIDTDTILPKATVLGLPIEATVN